MAVIYAKEKPFWIKAPILFHNSCRPCGNTVAALAVSIGVAAE
jgi:hypothetical protein